MPDCANTDIDFAHVKTRGSGGSDAQGVSLCRAHHSEQHTIGIETFQAKYKIDLFAIAAEFAKQTTDKALRATMIVKIPYHGRIS